MGERIEPIFHQNPAEPVGAAIAAIELQMFLSAAA